LSGGGIKGGVKQAGCKHNAEWRWHAADIVCASDDVESKWGCYCGGVGREEDGVDDNCEGVGVAQLELVPEHQ
jgi:hypothetical protein